MKLLDTQSETFKAALKQYEEDGATVLRGVFDLEWIEKLAEGTERLMASGHNEINDFARKGEGRFFGDLFASLRTPEYQDFIHNSHAAQIAAAIMRSAKVRFFYDQPLVKEPGTAKRTPWHQDYPYWPCSGWQVASLWVPLDPATPDSGVVTYVKGSHKWNAYYPVENWSDNSRAMEKMSVADEAFGDKPVVARPGKPTGDQLRTLADIRDHPEKYDLLTWDVKPGDVLIHQCETIHGAPGNLSTDKRRRAVAFRFFGDDARWDDSRPHFMRDLPKLDPKFPYPDLKTGDPIEAPIFPLVWPKQGAAK